MVIALASQRARGRAQALLHRPLGYVWDWQPGPKAGYAEVTEQEYVRIKHLPGITKARSLRPPMTQLSLL